MSKRKRRRRVAVLLAAHGLIEQLDGVRSDARLPAITAQAA